MNNAEDCRGGTDAQRQCGGYCRGERRALEKRPECQSNVVEKLSHLPALCAPSWTTYLAEQEASKPSTCGDSISPRLDSSRGVSGYHPKTVSVAARTSRRSAFNATASSKTAEINLIPLNQSETNCSVPSHRALKPQHLAQIRETNRSSMVQRCATRKGEISPNSPEVVRGSLPCASGSDANSAA